MVATIGCGKKANTVVATTHRQPHSLRQNTFAVCVQCRICINTAGDGPFTCGEMADVLIKGGPHAAAALERMDCEELGDVLVDVGRKIGERMRAVFFIRTKGGEEAVAQLRRALRNKGDSVLLRHEIAYVLGQLQLPSAVPALSDVLQDVGDHPVVRHEAGEAIGAIGHTPSIDLLRGFCDDEQPEVSETCKIAVKRLAYLLEHPEKCQKHEGFCSVDPAPPFMPDEASTDVEDIVNTMLDESLPLFNRYQAMFTLRNMKSKDAVLGLARGLSDPSALFRHEVAYVLGQVADPAAVPALTACLKNDGEHGMVRHEAAEALGAVGTKECCELLREHCKDPDPLVSESCETALDSVEYWQEFEGVES